MKSIKIVLMIAIIVFFSSVSFVVEAKDCSHLKELHKKLICKSGSDIYDSDANITSSKTKKVKKKNILEALKEKVKKAESFNEEYDSLSDILKKKKE